MNGGTHTTSPYAGRSAWTSRRKRFDDGHGRRSASTRLRGCYGLIRLPGGPDQQMGCAGPRPGADALLASEQSLADEDLLCVANGGRTVGLGHVPI